MFLILLFLVMFALIGYLVEGSSKTTLLIAFLSVGLTTAIWLTGKV